MSKKMTICVDAGHGGGDPGAVGRVKEKDANLIVAMALRELLWKDGHQVVMTRHADNTVALMERAHVANLSRTDLFISIHHNAGGGDGWEAIHSVFHGEGKSLAECIGAEFSKTQNPHGVSPIYDKKGTHGGDFFTVISETKMPAIILEYAFVDSKDAAAIDSEAELKGEAKAIAAGVRAYMVMLQAAEREQAVKDRNSHSPVSKGLAEFTETATPAAVVAGESVASTPAPAGSTDELVKQPKPEEAEAMSSVNDDDHKADQAPAKDSEQAGAPKGKDKYQRGRRA